MILWIRRHLGWIIAVILGVLCIFFINAWIDARITIDHAWRVVDWERSDKKILYTLLQETGKRMNRSEIEQIVTKHFGKDYLIKKEEPDELSIDNVILKFKGDSLVEIKSMND